ncbi:RNA polymerase III subunit C82 [Coemansia sp. RSA 1822]|nr:RNA polymerase III subunit C82 [Coemansia sp. RSA 638]KAJ2121260.1 RNA polymerase III subunit C82 [Coemansia sp. RSA 720]KAJ2545174.1 RNA polymerase III subunit C82 [Coemansia sp. RSA 1853]KAJ2564506.1 RNA polymerase III subunit C82 [Coemansia sp. RSA 1822]
MFTQLEDLCRRLVRNHYGPIVEKVVALLIEEGRLSLGRIISQTGMEGASARQALAVLIQHSHVTHAQGKEGARMMTFYSINLRNILRLQRAGLYLALAEERMGAMGLSVFRTIMTNGCMSVSGVRDVLGYKKFGTADKQKFSVAVAKLVRERFITAITATDTVTKVDRFMQAEAKEIEKLTTAPTPKELVNIRRRISDKYDEEYTSNVVVGMKRQMTDIGTGGAPKVMIGPNGQPIVIGNGFEAGQQDQDADEDLVDDKQCFQIYYERLDVFLRNKRIVNYFAEKYNDEASVVLKAILRLTEPRTKTCKDKVSESIAAQQIVQNISSDAQLDQAVDMSGDPYFKENGTDSGSSSAARKATLGKMAFALLDVLRRDASGIINKVDERGAGQYRVNFERAAIVLRDECLDSLVLNKFSSTHVRVVRTLRDKQKLDEKLVSQAAMLPLARSRELLHELTLAGFADTVEIPRTTDRNPSRMVYLWYVSPQKQVSAALRGALQGISNIMQRADQETLARAALVAKSQRADVVAGTTHLTPGEQASLQVLGKLKQQIDVCVIRLDTMLLLLHDMVPGSTAL